MSRTTPVHTALTAFRTTIDGHTYDVSEGERVVSSHPLVARYPQHFEEFTLRHELAVRSARVDELARLDTRTTSSTPVSRAGRAEAEQDRFWRSTIDLLDRDTRTSEQRAEGRFFDGAISQLEDLDQARLREETDGFREMWAGRLPAER